MQFRANLVLLLLALAITTTVHGSSLPDSRLPQTEVIGESANGVTVRLSFDAAILRAGDTDLGESGLVVHVPGTAPLFKEQGITLPALTRFIAVPPGYSVNVIVRSRSETVYDTDPDIFRDHLEGRQLRDVDPPVVEVGEPGWMRYMYVSPVAIHPVRYDSEKNAITAIDELEIEFEFTPNGVMSGPSPDPDRYGSLAFEQFFSAMLLNPNQPSNIPVNGKVVKRGSYLIITDEALSRATIDFADWKRSKGFDVIVEPMYYDGIQTAEIKEYIQDAYDNWERPPEFVLLIGDVNAIGIQMPSYYLRNPGRPEENDVSDQPYVLLEGNDYFPDAFIGRISSDSPSFDVALKALLRCVYHERDAVDIVDADPDAYHRATLWAGNFGDGNLPVVSPVETTRWLGERLRERGYDVEEFYYRDDEDDINPDPIVESINRGVNIVAYRGWADASGTHYPQFYKPNLDDLDNGPLLPVFTIFVCNTGDFGNSIHNPCFGEYSITRGDLREPDAALAFFGPSDLHTSTKFNNPMLAGYYSGLLYEGIRVLGPLTLRGKLEVYRGFPYLRGTGDLNFVEFYFAAYNILGDPELNIYLDAPYILDVTHTEALSVGDSRVRIVVTKENRTPVKRALVTLLKDDETEISVLTDADGVALLPVELNSQGNLELTVIAYQAAAYQAEIPVTSAENMVGIAGVEIGGGGLLTTGSPVNLTITLRNTGGAAANNVSAALSSPNMNIEIIQEAANFGNVAAGQSAVGNQAYRVKLSPAMAYMAQVPFELDITDGADRNYQALFRLPVSDGALMLHSYEFEGGALQPGAPTEFIMTVGNYGDQPVSGLRAELHSHDESIRFDDNRATFGDVAAHENIDCADDPFTVNIQAGTRIGRRVELRVVFFDGEDNQLGYRIFNITVGVVDIDDPIGPDGYGYFAYEDIDDADYYSEVPTFDWIELDPDHDGEDAEEYLLDDDTVELIDLPFSFRFYGRDFNQITICDNGWLSFGETWMNNFRNWGIPSPLGPHSMVMPFWDDLTNPDPDDPTNVNLRSPVKVLTRYDQQQDRFVIEWSRATNRQYLYQAPKEETFEVILYNPDTYQTPTGDGEILFQYLVVNNSDDVNNFATVGIQGHSHRNGLQVTFANLYRAAADTLRNRRAIKFTTNPPDDFEGTEVPGITTPVNFELADFRPNPFNSSTTISYTIPEAGRATLSLWDLNGRKIRELTAGYTSAGTHSFLFEAGGLPSGIYMVKLDWAGQSLQKKTLLLR